MVFIFLYFFFFYFGKYAFGTMDELYYDAHVLDGGDGWIGALYRYIHNF
jgi:hypothetical protein